MGRTPAPPKGQNVETMTYTVPKDPDPGMDAGGSHASYTPTSSINELSYGRSGGKPAAMGAVPEVVVGGSSEVAALPAWPATLTVGVNKNVSTPVTG